jgi:hypothetical protein
MKKKRSSKSKAQKSLDEYRPITLDKFFNPKTQNKVSFNISNTDRKDYDTDRENIGIITSTNDKTFFSGYSELTRLIIFVIFLSLAGYIFYVLVFERSIQGKIMRFVASVVPED